MITGEENLLQIAEMNADLISIFEKHGIGKYFKPDNLKKIGRFTRLNTLLKSNNLDAQQFIKTLNEIIKDLPQKEKSGMENQENLHFAAMLPCGLRNPFKEYVEAYFNEHPEKFTELNFLIEGNVNHELSYYPLLDSIKDANELPDIIMAADVNNFFHKPFIERFIDTGVFGTYQTYTLNNYLEKENYSDPNKNYSMYTANMLVMVVNKEKLGDRKMPEKWEDLLDPAFENDIIMRGENDFFCNAVMLPFYKEKGMDAIKILAKNIKKGLHPAEMVKMAPNNTDEAATIYILPWFFSKRIKSKKVKVVWPSDGAIASPVFLLAKKDKIKKNKDLLDFLFSKELGNVLNDRFFPSTHPEIANKDFPNSISWLGWDFLKNNDIGQLKEDIRVEFMKIWKTKAKNECK